jgi:hypothetical protein
MTVKINPKGQREHDHSLMAKINNASIHRLQQLLGVPHGSGEENKMSVEWFVMTEHGSATINDYWALNDGEFQINAGNQAAALMVVEYMRQHGLQAYVMYGEM